MFTSFSPVSKGTFALALAALTLAGCKKDDDKKPATSENKATATIGTTNFVSTKVMTEIDEPMINLIFAGAGTDTLEIDVPQDVNSGQEYNYTAGTGNFPMVFISYSPGLHQGYLLGQAGTSYKVKVTQHDKSARVIKGTFNTTLKTVTASTPQLINITNGTFDAKY